MRQQERTKHTGTWLHGTTSYSKRGNSYVGTGSAGSNDDCQVSRAISFNRHSFNRHSVMTSRRTFDSKRSEEHTSESSHVAISYAVFCLKKKKKNYGPVRTPLSLFLESLRAD